LSPPLPLIPRLPLLTLAFAVLPVCWLLRHAWSASRSDGQTCRACSHAIPKGSLICPKCGAQAPSFSRWQPYLFYAYAAGSLGIPSLEVRRAESRFPHPATFV